MTCRGVDIDGRPAIVCGDRPPAAEDLAKIADVLRITDGGGTMAEAREAAGLSLGQAAKVLGVERAHLASVEAGETRDDLLVRRMLKAYDVTGFVPTVPR